MPVEVAPGCPDTGPAHGVRRPQLLEGGLFAVVIALPLIFTPFLFAPFVDPKLVVLLLGALLAVMAHPVVDRPIAAAAGAWVTGLLVSALLGVDPWWSVMGGETVGMGVLALGASAVLLCVGTAVPEGLRGRLPTWLFWTAVVVSAVFLLGRFVDLGGVVKPLAFMTSTMGHRVFVGGIIGAAVVGATVLRTRPWTIAGLLVLGSGLAVSATRVAWIGTTVGLLFVAWRGRPGRREMLAVVLPVGLAMTVWTLVDRFLPRQGDIGFSAASRFGDLTGGSAGARLEVWEANLRAWADGHTVLGSGLGTQWGRFLSHATPEELRPVGRGWGDAHNVFVELGVTTGALGVLLLLVLMGVVAWRARNASPARAWAGGVALSLLVFHLFQPLDLVLTPLLFLIAGLAVAPSPGSAGVRLGLPVVVLLALVLVLGIARFGAATLEHHGFTSDSEASLRVARTIGPGRLTPTELLAKRLAAEGRSGGEAAAEARRLSADLVARGSWNPEPRLTAIEVEVLLGTPEEARPWLEEQLERFPNDPETLERAARFELDAGDLSRAHALARRALDIKPSPVARDVLDEVAHRSRVPSAVGPE